ncbi:hypothetical protein K6119_06980 [Paracrocinitomix mangrovi]|uniref:hypothetical protein n=1 Tax=Paracrocinitomix mangrovi TaxID=2862509 RepID=UPI001C8CF477|nr:hypothetical protein [Paracrocinitomix mangrovi]UKN03257.1 hypothetical protein K6119_06980 [Paracrocinitomix mangrovi]
MANFKFKYGVVTGISRDGIEITEQNTKNFKIKNKSWWVEWVDPYNTMPMGTRVSYIEPKIAGGKAFIRNIEKRFE